MPILRPMSVGFKKPILCTSRKDIKNRDSGFSKVLHRFCITFIGVPVVWVQMNIYSNQN